ncbi:hypothetical protein GYMLUDRAFT_937945 [Collybiopsis luxurians FD-317 M1]|uniref:Uncharacterized protein n=1 Tax=Collybiopsis luxurians FD-317 M1 TaxID=944289 RepID=A0A0D0CEC4_9AGAR|nr:hypothetical protein GYMLUDRAFT_937945 [Collybiopsis luxurians FD-317 M1]
MQQWFYSGAPPPLSNEDHSDSNPKPPSTHFLHPPGPASSSLRNHSPFRLQEGYPPGLVLHKADLPRLPNNTNLVTPQSGRLPDITHSQHLLPVQQMDTLQEREKHSQQAPPPPPPPRRHAAQPPPSDSTSPHVQPRQPVLAPFPVGASSSEDLYTPILQDDPEILLCSGNDSISTQLAPNNILDELSIHYIKTVAYLQYPLVDKACLSRVLSEDIQNNDRFARRAARLLASVHVQRSTANIPRSVKLTLVKGGYKELLYKFCFSKQQFDADDALCALNVISAFLFNGGRGDWERWLPIASSYSVRILENRTRFHNCLDALTNCEDKERFIIMTAFRFDVIASVTTMESPILFEAIDDLYDPNNLGIEISDNAADVLSMLPIMGCENRIMWAITQISSLYVWKQNQQKERKLSNLELHRRADDIESHLAPPDPSLEAKSAEDVPRLLASEAFRTSAIVYLRTVVHGDYPFLPQIAQAVNEAVGYLEGIIAAPENVRHAAVRSTVFPFFICAALTTQNVKRKKLLSALIDEGEVGNCRGIVELLMNTNPETGEARAVPWRAVIRGSKMLLV